MIFNSRSDEDGSSHYSSSDDAKIINRIGCELKLLEVVLDLARNEKKQLIIRVKLH